MSHMKSEAQAWRLSFQCLNNHSQDQPASRNPPPGCTTTPRPGANHRTLPINPMHLNIFPMTRPPCQSQQTIYAQVQTTSVGKRDEDCLPIWTSPKFRLYTSGHILCPSPFHPSTSKLLVPGGSTALVQTPPAGQQVKNLPPGCTTTPAVFWTLYLQDPFCRPTPCT